MLKFITNMPISRRLLLAFLLAAVVPGMVISALGFTFFRGQAERNQVIRTNINAFKSATKAGSYLPDLNTRLNTIYLEQYQSRQTTNKSQAQADITLLHQTAALFDHEIYDYQKNYELLTSRRMRDTANMLKEHHLDQTLPSQQQQTLRQVLHVLWPRYQAAQDQALNAMAKKAPASKTHDLITTTNTAYISLESSWDQVTTLAANVNMRAVTTDIMQTRTIILLTILAFFGTVMMVTCIGYVAYRTITIPLHQLALLTQRIALGDTQARAEITTHDEIYLVAISMNNMLDNIVNLIHETKAQRDRLQGQVELLVEEVRGIGEGDLSVQTEISDTAIGILADTFNYIIEELGGLVVRVKRVASEVTRSTTTILSCMSQMLDSDKLQLQQLDSAGAEIEQIAMTSRTIAERAKALNNVVRIARRDVQNGRDSIAQVIEEMGHINGNVDSTCEKVHSLDNHSREIDEVIEVISSIAHQTNRLALDAAIQSAMAGENGKGFGAVAADIRRLAERTKDQTTVITRIVRSIREEIGVVGVSMQDTRRETASGMRLTLETGESMEAIFAAVEHQAREIENINLMTKQQLQCSKNIVLNMQGIGQATQQNSMRTDEASDIVKRLAYQVERLCLSVQAFTLRQGENYYASREILNMRLNPQKYVPAPVPPPAPIAIPATENSAYEPINSTLNPLQRVRRRYELSLCAKPPESIDDYCNREASQVPDSEQASEQTQEQQGWDNIPQSEAWLDHKPRRIFQRKKSVR